jgi:hypothetical protein
MNINCGNLLTSFKKPRECNPNCRNIHPKSINPSARDLSKNSAWERRASYPKKGKNFISVSHKGERMLIMKMKVRVALLYEAILTQCST